MNASPKEFFLLFLLITFFFTAISWIFFARFTMSRIEKKIVEDGFSSAANWDGIGARAILYAYAIILPNKYAQRIENKLLNSVSIKGYANSTDRMSGAVFLISSNLLALGCFFGWLIWGNA